uniref:Uncharacterized protein n=1 Tax=Arundo donax TaxID=35708 RepID=A0A0A9ACN5_ARUDO
MQCHYASYARDNFTHAQEQTSPLIPQ